MRPISKNEFMAMPDEEKWETLQEAMKELSDLNFEGMIESEIAMAEGPDLGQEEGEGMKAITRKD